MAEAQRTWGGLTADERERQRRERLVAAALDGFGTNGWGSTSVRDLCTASGLSPRYFYAEFADREACFAAVLESIADEVRATVRAALTASATPEARLERVLTDLVRLFSSDRRKLRVAFVESFATEELRARRAAVLSSLAALGARLMRTLVPDGTASDRELFTVSYALAGGLAQALVDLDAGYVELDEQGLVRQLSALYLRAAG